MSKQSLEAIREVRCDAVMDFLEKKAAMGRSSGTLRQYSIVFRRFFHQYFPELAPEEVEIRHVEEFLQRLEEDYEGKGRGQNSMSAKSKQSYLHVLTSFYSWAMKRPSYEQITGNPAAPVVEEVSVTPPDRPDVATWENAKKIIHAIDDPRNKTAAVIMAKTGCRVGETVGLDEDDIRIDDGFILFRDRKGGGRTLVPIDEEVEYQIQRYDMMKREHSNEAFFNSRKGNRLSQRRIRLAVREAAVESGVMQKGETDFYKKFTPHTFRTVFTTLMRKQGMTDHILRYIRGDSDQDMLDLYTRIDPEEAKQEYLNCIKTLKL